MAAEHFAVNLHINQSKMRGRTICLIINLFICFYGKSQKTAGTAFSPSDTFYDSTYKTNVSFSSLDTHLTVSRSVNTSVKTVPSTLYFNSIGFFCQKELQVEKALKLAVKFRLGSVDYTDELEGKGKGRP